MLSKVQKSIMIKAIRYRLDDGEELNTIMDSYTKLSEEDKRTIISEMAEILQEVS